MGSRRTAILGRSSLVSLGDTRSIGRACGSSKRRTPQKLWLSSHRPDSLSAMRKMLILLLVALLHRPDRALAASYFESLAVRQQLAVLNRKTPRPRLQTSDRWFWGLISSFWPDWRDALAIVKPATVIGWHRKGFRLFWTWKSRSRRSGRPPVSWEVRDLIGRMCRENPLWGAPRIHGELLKLGFEVSERTVSRYILRHPKPPSQTWRTFLEKHLGCLASMDLFVVPTAAFWKFMDCTIPTSGEQHEFSVPTISGKEPSPGPRIP